MFRLNYHSWTKTRLRLVTVSLFPFSLCVFVCISWGKSPLFYFIFRSLFSCRLPSFRHFCSLSLFISPVTSFLFVSSFPHCSFFFYYFKLFFFTHSSSLCFSVWPNICLSLSPFNNFPSPTWVSLSFSFPFTPSLSALLCIPSVSRYSGWLSFHPIAYRHDLGFISLCAWVCVSVCVCGHVFVC